MKYIKNNGNLKDKVEIEYLKSVVTEQEEKNKATQQQILALQNALITSKISGGGITTITDSSDNQIKNLKVFGKSEHDMKPSYNLFPVPKISEVKNEQGSFKRVNADGSVTIKNVANNSTTPNDWSVLNAKNENVFDDNPELLPGDYSLFLDGTSDNENKTVQILIVLETSGVIIIKTNKDLGWHDFAIPKKEKMKILYRPQRLSENYEVTIKAMITTRENKGKPFVKYGASEVSPENPQEIISVGGKGSIKLEIKGTDSELQEFNIKTPNGLPGIKVDTGGNCTDSTGQQWIADEIDLARGKYVQRVKKINAKVLVWRTDFHKEFKRYSSVGIPDIRLRGGLMSNRFIAHSHSFEYGLCSNEETGKLRCCFEQSYDSIEKVNEFFNTNETYFMYELVTPIETDLPPETIEAFKSLYTNYPTTVISNDENAGIEVSYVADTKHYIDKKFEELNQAIVNTQIALL